MSLGVTRVTGMLLGQQCVVKNGCYQDDKVTRYQDAMLLGN